VTGLPPGIDNESLRGLFSQYGQVVQCKVLPSPNEGMPTHALVRFTSTDEAASVKKSLTGYALEGVNEPLVIEFALQKPRSSEGQDWGQKGGCAGKGWGGNKGGCDGSWGGKSFDDGSKGGWGGKGFDDGGEGWEGKGGFEEGCEGGWGGKGSEESGWGGKSCDDGGKGWGSKGCDKGCKGGWGGKGCEDSGKGGWGGKGFEDGGKGGWADDEDGSKGCGKGGKGGKPLDRSAFTPPWGGMDRILQGFLEAQCLPGHKLGNEDNCLFVSGLPKDCDDIHLYRLLAPFGAITPTGVKAMKFPDGTCKGFGFVNFVDAANMQAAAMMLHGTQLPDGSTMSVVQKKAKQKGSGRGGGCSGCGGCGGCGGCSGCGGYGGCGMPVDSMLPMGDSGELS